MCPAVGVLRARDLSELLTALLLLHSYTSNNVLCFVYSHWCTPAVTATTASEAAAVCQLRSAACSRASATAEATVCVPLLALLLLEQVVCPPSGRRYWNRC